MRLWRRRPAKSPSPAEEPISQEDLAWRIGATDERPLPSPSPVAQDRAVKLPFVTRARPVVSSATRRLVLWRDASAILFGILAFVLVAQLALSGDGRETAADASGAASGLPSDVALGGTTSPGDTELPTIGPVVDPSLISGIEATPTPVPTPTLRPVATPRPVRRPPPRATPKLTPRPTLPAATAAPTAVPTPTPSPTATPFIGPPPPPPPDPTPTPTPVPTPTAAFACSVTGPLDISCTDSSQDAVGYLWDFGDGVGTSTATNPSYTYTAARTYTVTLTVTNPSGSNSTTQDVTVPGL